MTDHNPELQLLWCVLLNVAVFGSAWLFAIRRITSSRSQAILDAVLLGYAIQYAAVGLPGLIGQLTPVTIVLTANFLVAGLLIAAFRCPSTGGTPVRQSIFIPGIAVFAVGFVLAFVQIQAYLPVMSNDAMTYHIPAAVQWLQRGRIDLFQTWFFNPANTYSPLAGSTFIAWLIAPFGSDVLARYVELPALGCIALAVYRLLRQLKTGQIAAALVAVAAILCRPIFMQGLMAKDDLFLAFFFIAILVAMSPERAREKFGACRLGIALGLLLATKYTALMALPVLLLAVDGPITAGWGARQWFTIIAVAAVLAGPWYLRNILLTGNPLFPMKLPGFHGLFTTTSSESFGSFQSAFAVVVGGSYSLPIAVAVLLGMGWIAGVILGFAKLRSDPLLRVCLLGPMTGIAIFYFVSPFPEVRFILPEILLLFAAMGFAISRFKGDYAQSAMAVLILFASVATVLVPDLFWQLTARFIAVGGGAAAVIMAMLWAMRAMKPRLRAAIVVGAPAILIAGWLYVNWTAYVQEYQAVRHDDNSGYAQEFPREEQLWRFVDENIPADATVAYTNLYLISPLEGFNFQRRLVYVPTRAGVQSIADLPWLGDRLSGEKLVPAASMATVALPDRAVWLKNLKAAGARYLIVGRGGVVGTGPEAVFAEDDPRFHRLFDGERGVVYHIEAN